jgi:hypothetical protein
MIAYRSHVVIHHRLPVPSLSVIRLLDPQK